jgi:hypothetical protein
MLFFRECFISGLKEDIRVHVLMAHPQSWMEATKRDKEAQQVVSTQTRKPSFIPCPKFLTPTPLSAPLKIQKLTRAKMVELQLKGLCYNCDEKYFLGHKCKEQKLFMDIFEDVSKEEVEALPMVESLDPTNLSLPMDPPEVEPVISLTGFSAPQTLKLFGYIKHRKVIILIDSARTHNFIHRHLSQETNCYICVISKFHIMIANGGYLNWPIQPEISYVCYRHGWL